MEREWEREYEGAARLDGDADGEDDADVDVDADAVAAWAIAAAVAVDVLLPFPLAALSKDGRTAARRGGGPAAPSRSWLAEDAMGPPFSLWMEARGWTMLPYALLHPSTSGWQGGVSCF